MVQPSQVRDQTDMKLHNRMAIWNLIVNSRPVSRAQLAKMTAMSPTSITRIVGEILNFGLLVETPAFQGGVGRKATLLDINRDAFFTLGIDIDADAIQTCLVDPDNQPRAFLSHPLDERQLSPEQVLDIAQSMVESMLTAGGMAKDAIQALGVSIGGTVDRVRGMVAASPQLHWKNVELGALLRERFHLPAIFENDVKAAIYEEYTRHTECRSENIAYLTIGSGVGAALMFNGRILRGSSNAAGEIGHVTVQPGGELCDCGRHGCLYTCLSEQFILRKIRRLTEPEAGFDRWVTAQAEGEAWATGLASEVSGFIAQALNQLLCSYDPEVIIVGGRLMASNPGLLPMALERKGFIYDALRSDPKVIPSLTGKEDAVIGAAIMAKTAYLEALLNEKPVSSHGEIFTGTDF